jgi:hypothetical protein
MPVARSEIPVHERGRQWLGGLAPYIAGAVGLFALIAVFVARVLYRDPCLDDCSNRSWAAEAQQTVALIAIVPVGLLIFGLLRRRPAWVKVLSPVLIATYVAWIVLITQIP